VVTAILLGHSLFTRGADLRASNEQFGCCFVGFETLDLGVITVKLLTSLSFVPGKSMEHTGSKLASVAYHHRLGFRILVDLTRTAPWAKAHIEAWCIRHEEIIVSE
jgi:hypothetical protein